MLLLSRGASLTEGNVKSSSRENSFFDKISPNTSLSNTNSIHFKGLSSKLTQNTVKDRSVMIICCPNATTYEIFAYSDGWVEFYIENGINVLLWNYRGYGESIGNTSFDNMCKDSEEIVYYLRKNYKFNKIGVHGISIGAIPAAYLANKNLINFCYCDRAFQSLSSLLKSIKCGNILNCLRKLLFIKDFCNVDLYIKSNCFKVISADPSDNIINEMASLKSGISQFTLKSMSIKNKDNILLNILDEKEYFAFIKSLTYFVNIIYTYDYSRVVTSEENLPNKYSKLGDDSIRDSELVVTSEENVQKDEGKIILSVY